MDSPLIGPIGIVALVIGVLYLGYLYVEQRQITRLRTTFKHVIHIQGTRGKSTVTRLIGAALREANIPTLTKVTGTTAAFILPDGKEVPIRRKGPANIREQITMMRLAAKMKADVLVIECMAITPRLAYITEHKILKASILVLTQTGEDHQEIGEHAQEEAFKSVIPNKGIVFGLQTIEALIKSSCEELTTLFQCVDVLEHHKEIDHYPENAALAMAVADYLEIDSALAKEAMKATPRDFGESAILKHGNTQLLNLFAVNDVASLQRSIDQTFSSFFKNHEPIVVLITNRTDRPLRAMKHLAWLETVHPKEVYVKGPFLNRFKKRLKETRVYKYETIEQLDGKYVVGIGNIHPEGERIIHQFMNKGLIDHG